MAGPWHEFVIIGFNVTLTGAMIAVVSTVRPLQTFVLLTGSVISFVLSILHQEQERAIATVAGYLHSHLRESIVALLDVDPGTRATVFGWEEFRRQKIYHAALPIRLIGAVGSLAGLLPGFLIVVGVLTLSIASPGFRATMGAAEYALLGVDLALLGFVGIMLHSTIRLYGEITRPAVAPPSP